MADLDFKRHVPAPAQGADLPTYKGEGVKAEVTTNPDLNTAISRYAGDTNWMSALGSEVATRSSNAIAAQLGGNKDKNPTGDLMPPITDFDKAFTKSYETQAQATLGLKANELITKSNLELAKQPRLSSDMISKANGQVSLGLQNIFKNAPSEIRPHLEYQYQTQQMSQTAELTRRMISEQRTDQKNNADASARLNNQNAHSNALNGVDIDKNGDSKAGLANVDDVVKTQDGLLAVHNTTKEEADVKKDTAKVSYLSGKYTRLALEADKEGKLGEFEKNWADHPPADVPDKYHAMVTQNMVAYMNEQHSLRIQNQQLKMQEMHNLIQTDPEQAVANWGQFQSEVTPLQEAQMKFNLLQAQKSGVSQKVGIDELMRNWGNSEEHANAKPEIQNATFYKLVDNTMASHPNLTKDQAETQVAMSAGAPIPVFLKSIQNKLTSGNPENIESGANQVKTLNDAEAGHALVGLSKTAQAIGIQFNHQRGSMPDSDLARQITKNLINIDDSKQKILDNAWGKILDQGDAGGLGAKKPLYRFALDAAGLKSSNLGGKYFEVIYGNDLYDQLKSNFDAAGGDYEAAKEMTQNYAKQNYGETHVNGDSQVTDRPIEKTLGYKDFHVVPFIHQDMLNQFNAQFEAHKGERNETWSVAPLEGSTGGFYHDKYKPAQIIRTVQTDKGEKKFSYPVNLVGRPGGEWDVVVQTPSGARNFFLVAPQMGIMTYKPNAAEIRKNYDAYIAKKGWF